MKTIPAQPKEPPAMPDTPEPAPVAIPQQQEQQQQQSEPQQIRFQVRNQMPTSGANVWLEDMRD